MPKYTVTFQNVCSYSLTVEADDPVEAIATAEDSEDMAGGITVGAFSTPFDNSVDDGEWVAVTVEDEKDNIVWGNGVFAYPPE